LTGFLFDLDMSRIGPTFLDEVAQAAGKAAASMTSSSGILPRMVGLAIL
jgi:hypothetical protein